MFRRYRHIKKRKREILGLRVKGTLLQKLKNPIKNKTDSARKTKSVCRLKFNFSYHRGLVVPSAQFGAVQILNGVNNL